jgi:hypothetical protein
MFSFLFWNLAKQPLQTRVARLAATFQLDVVMLAECAVGPNEVIQALNSFGGQPYCFPFSEGKKIRIFTKLPESSLVDKFNDPLGGLTIRQLRPGKGPSLLLAVVHFPSKMDWHPEDQLGGAAALARDIIKVEGKRWPDRTVLVGDFNMNPFDAGVVSAHALHAVMTRELAERSTREVKGIPYPFFYNPMWACFGDRTAGPPGSFYLGTSKPVNYFWNVYDQVLLRPGLVPSLREVRILDTDGVESLLSGSGLPDKSRASDHLPLLFQLEL